MAKYGSNRYGAGFKYGESTTVSVYYNSNISAWSYDYGTIRLNWDPITPDPTENAPTHWKLVKSYTGLPDNPEDGILVAGGSYASFLTSYTDINYNNTGLEANYSIWVFNGDRWIFCGSDFAIIVGDKDSLTKLTTWLPKAWTNPINATGEALGESNSNTFMQLMASYAFVYDKLRAEASLLGKSTDHLYIPGSLLKYRVQDLGFNYEPALGDSYHRSLFGAGNSINAYKGTPLGIGIYTTALTHWGNDVLTGNNLMLDYNDSSFEESIGNWGISLYSWYGSTPVPLLYPMTLTHQDYSTSLANLGITVAPPSPGLYDKAFPPLTKGFMAYRGSGATYYQGHYFRLPAEDGTDGTANGRDVKKGIPVTPGKRYVFSGWVRTKNARPNTGTYAQPNVNFTLQGAQIWFYDKDNNHIGSSGIAKPVWYTNSWQEFHTGRVDPDLNGDSQQYYDRVGHKAPANSAYAVLKFYAETDNTLGDLYFDMFQLSEGDKSYEYQDARRIEIHVKGQKENYLPNPDFKEGLGSWSGYNGVLSNDSSNSAALLLGTHAAKLTSSLTGTAGYVSDWVPVEAGKVVTFSGYVLASTSRTAVARIEFSNLASVDQQTAILSDEEGLFYPQTINYVDSDPVTVDGVDLVRVHVSAIVPPYTRDAGESSAKASIYFTDNEPGDSYWLDGAMLEEKDSPSYYYSGEGGVFPEDPTTQTFYSKDDCFWEIKNTYNYMSNPSFQTNTTDWSATSGTLTRVSSDGSYGPLYGTHFGKLSFTTSGSLTGTAYLDSEAVGGEDVTISAYVRGAVGTYTIGDSTYHVDSNNYVYWSRIHTTVQLTPGQSTVPFTISFTKDSGATSTYFHIDGVQVEHGRIVSQFVDPQAANSVVVTSINPIATTKNFYLTQAQSSGGGTSSYFNNYKTKFARLSNTLPLVLPKGASWAIKTGALSSNYGELTESLIPSASFELDLGSWRGINSTLTRVISKGSLFSDTLTHGQAYCKVSASTAAAFGIKVDYVYLNPNGGYYSSVAIRPGNTLTLGTYTLLIRFYDANFQEIVVYVDNITGQYTTSSLDRDGAPNTIATDEARTKSIEITTPDRWAYLANTFPVSSITGAAYADIKITYESGTYTAGQYFHVDRVVFRQ